MSNHARIRRVGTLIALGSAAIYGAVIPAARIASQAGVPAGDVAAYRALVLVPLLALLARLAGESLAVPKGERLTVFILSTCAAATGTFYLSSVDTLPVPIAVTVFYVFPLWVLLVRFILDGQRPSLFQIGVFVVAFSGLAIAVGPSFAGISLAGLSFAVMASIACAGLFIAAAKVSPGPFALTFWTQVATLILAFALSVIKGGPVGPGMLTLAPIAIAIGVIGYLTSYLMQMKASGMIDSGRASLMYLFEPVVALTIAALVLGETSSLTQVIGIALILTALAAEVLFARPAGKTAG